MTKTEQQLILSLSRLAIHECANNMDGLCLPKDKPCRWMEYDINPDTGRPYPFGDKGITCPYFLKAVLPGNRNLQARYLAFINDYDGIRPLESVASNCERCKEPIIKASNRQKYCDSCKITERRKKKAAWDRDKYLNNKI